MRDDASFLPEDFQNRRMHRRTNAVCLGLFVIVMGAIFAAYGFTINQRDKVTSALQQVNAEYEDAARLLEQLDEMHRRRDAIFRKANVTSVLLERVPRSLVLADLVNRMPRTVSLRQLKLETQIVKRPPIKRSKIDQAKAAKKKAAEKASTEPKQPVIPPTRVEVTIIGTAETDVDVAQYMTTLGQSDLFHDLNLLYSEEVRGVHGMVRKFSVEMKLNQNVDVQAIKTLRVRRADEELPTNMPLTRVGEGSER